MKKLLILFLLPLSLYSQIQVNKVDTSLNVLIGTELVKWKSQDWTLEQIQSNSGGVQTVTGDLVDNTDQYNPIVNLPEWVYSLRADRVGGVNVQNGNIYQVGSSYVDATMFLAGFGTDFDSYTLRFPRLVDTGYKRHMLIFNVNISNIISEPLNGANLKNIPSEARINDIWTLTYDSFSNSWHLEAINSMPKWYIDSKVSKDDLSMMPEAGKVPVFSPQGLLSTGTPEFPENAVNLAYLDNVMGILNDGLSIETTRSDLNTLYNDKPIGTIVRSILHNLEFQKVHVGTWQRRSITLLIDY